MNIQSCIKIFVRLWIPTIFGWLCLELSVSPIRTLVTKLPPFLGTGWSTSGKNLCLRKVAVLADGQRNTIF